MRLILALCMMTSAAAAQEVVAFNGYSVTINHIFLTQFGGRPVPTDKTTAEAQRICSAVGKSAELATALQTNDMSGQFLFLCL
ncbi:MAG: hypothetical protein KKC72_08375 [Alphaproteobacteria bacterium]|nr:hypothetical protein [Alphaproteobacteria bacterium]